MGFRFHKSIKIAPGVKFNINKKSVGMTFGTKGAHYTVNSKGTRTKSVGIPGTGLSYTEVEHAKKGNMTREGNSSPNKSKGCGCGCLFLVIILIFVIYLILEY